MKNRKRFLRAAVLTVIMLLCLAMPASAAGKKNKWVKKSGYWYYYDKNGEKSTGLVKIGSRKYYFDESGKQRVGWRKIGKYYYKFRQKGKTGAYMLTNVKEDGITLRKSGRAKLPNQNLKKKAEVLAGYALWADGFFKTSMTNRQKMNACLKEIGKFTYRTANSPVNTKKKVRWDVQSAELVLKRYNALSEPYCECYGFAAGFAYLVNATGIKGVYLDGHREHAWVRIGDLLYDPTKVYTRNDRTGYFPMIEENITDYYEAVWSTLIG